MSGCALKEDGGGPVDEGAVDDVRVAGDPADVGHAAKHVPRLVVEHDLVQKTGIYTPKIVYARGLQSETPKQAF